MEHYVLKKHLKNMHFLHIKMEHYVLKKLFFFHRKTKYKNKNIKIYIIIFIMDNYKYTCLACDFKCEKRGDYNRHIKTKKHLKMISNDEKKYVCEICDKVYLNRSGLWRHKKVCIKNDETNVSKSTSNDKNDKLIDFLMKENKEIKELILEIVKNGTHNTTNTTNTTNTHTNSHNKAFNLNFFLNETCKNAMNITDFVDSIKLQLNDLMEVGELGYVEGISKIIVKNLNNLDETERPVHCTDKKRETMYVKDEGEWNKEDDNKSHLRKAITKVADKNIRLLPQFREKYPEYKNAYSKVSDKYDKMVVEVMTVDQDKNEKIIKNISKVTTIKDKV